MEKIDRIIAYPVDVWENMISKRNDITLKKVYFNKGLVSGAEGVIRTGEKYRNVKWLHNGRCYYLGKRVRQYDIHFSEQSE